MRVLNRKLWHKFDSEKFLGWVVSTLAFLFPLTVLSVNRADSIVLLLLGVIGVFAFLRHGIHELGLNRRALVLMGLFAAWYAVIVLGYFLGDQTSDGFKLLGRNLRLLFFIPAFIACWRYLSQPRWLFIGLLLAPFPVFALALFQYNPARFWARAKGFVDVIPFGDLSIAFAFMVLSALVPIWSYKKLWLLFLAGTALIAGMAASGLSGSRGGWIALPFFVAMTALVFSGGSRKRMLWIFGTCASLAFAASCIIPGTMVDNRLKDVGRSLASYRNYLRLAERGDIDHLGCINDPVFLKSLARDIEKRFGAGVGIAVVDDQTALAQAGLLTQCQSGAVIRLSNKSQSRTEHVNFGRTMGIPSENRTLQFIVRGQGSIAINGASKWAERFNDANYKLLTITQNTEPADRAIPYVFVAPGSTVYFAPVQNELGEYVYPFVTTSVGMRLEMWRVAWHIFLKYPVLGAGTGTFMYEAELLAAARKTLPGAADFDHPHNDYMNVMASWGLLGLVVWLLVIGYPLAVYLEALRSGEPIVRAAGFAGGIIVVGLLIFGLTETMFTHSIVLSWYTTFTAILTAIIFRNDPKPGVSN